MLRLAINTIYVPDNGQTHRVTLSVKLSVMHKSVFHVALNVACKSYLKN